MLGRISLGLSLLTALLAAAVLVAVAAEPARAGASPAARDAAAARAKAVSQAPVARRLVRSVITAKSAAARYRGTLELLRALRIGVVTRTGRPLVVAPEPNSARLLYLYDFEVRALAGQLARHETASYDEVAGLLTKGGLGLAPGRPFPAALLEEGVRDAVRAATRRPHSERSLLPLVIRELGLRRGQDPTRAGVQLDTLQAWLITVDLALPVLRKIPSSAPAPARASAASAADDCQRFTDAAEALQRRIEERLGGKIQSWIAQKGAGAIYDKVVDRLKSGATRWGIRTLPRWAVRGAWHAGRAVNVLSPLTSLVHGVLLAYSIKIESLDPRLETHYGHGGPGTQMVFRVLVHSLDDYGETAAKCGKLLGVELPRLGPIDDMTVAWEQAVTELAPAHGTVDCAKPLCTSKTGKDGIARLVFSPKQEEAPGVPTLERDAAGTVNAVPLYQSKFDAGEAGQLGQLLTPKIAGSAWRVTFHKPRGFKFVAEYRDECFGSDGSCSYRNDYVYRAAICGTSLAGTWRGPSSGSSARRRSTRRSGSRIRSSSGSRPARPPRTTRPTTRATTSSASTSR